MKLLLDVYLQNKKAFFIWIDERNALKNYLQISIYYYNYLLVAA